MTASGPMPPTGPASSGMGRLKRRADFQAVAKGRRYHAPTMTVQGLARDPAGGPRDLRVGFTVTKKVGHATERNRIRRRFRAAAAQALIDRGDIHADIVLVGRREALGAPFQALIDEIGRSLAVVTRPGKPARRSSGRTSPAPSDPAAASAAPDPTGRASPLPSPIPSSGDRRRGSHDG